MWQIYLVGIILRKLKKLTLIDIKITIRYNYVGNFKEEQWWRQNKFLRQ